MHEGTGLATLTGSPYKFSICYIVLGSYSFRNQGKVLMRGFSNGLAYKSLYIVGLFRYTHRIPSRNNMTTSDLWQYETRTFVGHLYTKVVRSQKGMLRMNELGSKGFFPARSFQWDQWYGCLVLSVVHCLGSDLLRPYCFYHNKLWSLSWPF